MSDKHNLKSAMRGAKDITDMHYTELHDQISVLTQERDALRADYEKATKLVAEMHAAAVGEVRGPIKGVVEDVATLRAALEELQSAVREFFKAEDGPDKSMWWDKLEELAK